MLKNKLHLLLVILFYLPGAEVLAQTDKSSLDKTVTLIVTNEKTDIVLSQLSKQTGVVFSYSPDVVDISKTVTANFVIKPLREVLNQIFEGKVDYKIKGKYLILQKKTMKPVKPGVKEFVEISGYVRSQTGDSIPWTSIYDKESLGSTVTNDYGFYTIRFNAQQLPVNLNFSKQGYVDTILVVSKTSPAFNNITLTLKPEPVAPVVDVDSLERTAEETASSFFSSLEDPLNSQNITDTIYREWQASLLPFIGTNGKLSGNVINEYSFNLFGGYSLGVTKGELSGFFNLNRGDVKYVQVAGFANLGGGEMEGVQLAGFSNIVRRNVKGVQLSGFTNVDFGKFEGFQGSGFCNIVMDSLKGVQAAGFCNVALKSVKGVQLGFINYARTINGSQLGFLNVCDTAKGVPVGFLSYVNTGYHKIEVSADEVFYTNIAFRTGVRSFHNILTAGVNPSNDSLLLWHFGYGVGTTAKLGKKAGLDFDLTASQIVKGDNFDHMNVLAKAYLGADIQLAKKFSLAFGVTLNGQITESDFAAYPDIFSWYEPNIIHEEVWVPENIRLQMWLGGKIALRFL